MGDLCDVRRGGVSLPDVPVPGYIFDLSFWQAGLASTSFDEKSVPGYIFAQLLAGRLYLGSNPPRKRRVEAVAYRGKSS